MNGLDDLNRFLDFAYSLDIPLEKRESQNIIYHVLTEQFEYIIKKAKNSGEGPGLVRALLLDLAVKLGFNIDRFAAMLKDLIPS